MGILDQIEKDLRNLREYRGVMDADVKTVMDDQRWSDSYKKQMADQRRQFWQNEAKKASAAAWRRAQQRIRDSEEAIRQATAAKDEGLNFTRLQVLRDEYAAELKRPENAMVGDTVARRLKLMSDRARQAGDREALRAIRVASADYTSKPVEEGSDKTLIGQIRRDLAADVDAEWRDVRAAEQDLNFARAGVDEVKRTILSLERDLYGLPGPDAFSTLSDWQREVLGETYESTGRVVWKTDEQPVQPS